MVMGVIEKLIARINHTLPMSSETAADNYTTIKLPKEFTELIDGLVNDRRLGFSSRTEVVKQAVREYYEKMKNFVREPSK